MSGTLHLAQALSNRGRRGRKTDFRDAERLVKRLVSQELVLSFVPDAEQRLWRTLTRTRYQRTRDKVRVQNQLEALLEEAHIKLSSLVSDLLGASARRMLKALADGETDPAALAALADQRLRATPAQLHDALGACTEINPVYRRLVKMTLDDLQFVEQQISQLDQEIASLLQRNQDAVERLAVVPGLGVDSAQQIIAEVGAKEAVTKRFDLAAIDEKMPLRERGHFSLWVISEARDGVRGRCFPWCWMIWCQPITYAG
jgi:transposase